MKSAAKPAKVYHVYYFINKLFFSQSSVYDEIQRITDYTSMFSRDRIRSYTKEGNTLYYFFGFCYFLEQDFIVVLTHSLLEILPKNAF